MKKTLNKLINKSTLSVSEAKEVLMKVGNSDYNDAQLVSFLTVFLMRKLTVEEFIGFREALLELSMPVDLDRESIDIVGTGGDGKDSFNISTISSLIVAGSGHKVVKHGSYASSSVSGSSNVLEYLGYKFTNNNDELKKQLDKANITFLHAPLFHPALKKVAKVRRDLGLKTIFNMLGPVVNPANPKYQLLGVHSMDVGDLYAKLLSNANVKYYIVNSVDGYDEVSLTSDFNLFHNGKHNVVTPSDIGFSYVKQQDLYGGDSVASAGKIFKEILEGKGTKAQNSVVLANSAYAIKLMTGYDYDKSLELAEDSLYGGKAKESFEKILV